MGGSDIRNEGLRGMSVGKIKGRTWRKEGQEGSEMEEENVLYA